MKVLIKPPCLTVWGLMRLINFANENYYHIYNRGVDKRTIFSDDLDRTRFLQKLNQFLFNGSEQISELVCYCLMNNHYHIILQQKAEHGISETMRRLGSSHTHYFNVKNSRTGRLFEGPYKIKSIETDAYLASLISYIHMNPISKDRRCKTQKELWEAIHFLENYQWSDCKEYLEGRGALSQIFNDISYIQFLRQNLRWRRGEPGSQEPGSG